MKKPGDLSQIFGRFSGKEIPMIEDVQEVDLPALGIKQKFPVISPANPNDPVLEDMIQEAQRNGLHLRLWWKGVAGTMDYRTDRVNATIEKSTDGKWRVSSRFNIG